MNFNPKVVWSAVGSFAFAFLGNIAIHLSDNPFSVEHVESAAVLAALVALGSLGFGYVKSQEGWTPNP